MNNNLLDTPTATHGFTPRGVLIWSALIDEVIQLRNDLMLLSKDIVAIKQNSPTIKS